MSALRDTFDANDWDRQTPLDSYFKTANVREIVNSIRSQGYAYIEDFFSDELVEELTSFVMKQSKERNEMNFSLREEELKSTLIAKLPHVIALKDLMYEVSLSLGEETDKASYYARMRIKLGNEISVDEGDMHFDGSFLTFVIPVILPETGLGGGLLVMPKARAFIKNSLFNRITRRFYSTGFFGLQWLKKIMVRPQEIYYKPNSLFVFEGWTTLHATAFMAAEARRVVLLIHSGDVKL